MLVYTPKNAHLFKVDKNRTQQQYSAAHIVYSKLSIILFSIIVTPDCGLIEAQQC